MMMPSKTNYRKAFKIRSLSGVDRAGSELDKGNFGLKIVTPGLITGAQIEASRRCIVRKLKKVGKLHIRVFTHTPVTKKPAETRMGGGKGSPEYWVMRVLPGRILFELEGVEESLAREAFESASYKLGMKTIFVKRDI